MTRTVTYDEPLSLDLVKQHLRILHSDDDFYLGVLIESSLEHAEDFTRRDLVEKTWTETKTFVPDPSGEPTTTCFLCVCDTDKPKTLSFTVGAPIARIDINDFIRITDSGSIRIVFTGTFIIIEATGDEISYDPSTRTACISTKDETTGECMEIGGDITTDWTTGTPRNISITARLLFIAAMYEHREQMVVGSIASELPMGFTRLLDIFSRSAL